MAFKPKKPWVVHPWLLLLSKQNATWVQASKVKPEKTKKGFSLSHDA